MKALVFSVLTMQPSSSSIHETLAVAAKGGIAQLLASNNSPNVQMNLDHSHYAHVFWLL